jgi:hypothetical protein
MLGTPTAAAGWIAVAAAGWIAVAAAAGWIAVATVVTIAATQAKAETHRRLIEVPIHRCTLSTDLAGAGRIDLTVGPARPMWVVRCMADLPR